MLNFSVKIQKAVALLSRMGAPVLGLASYLLRHQDALVHEGLDERLVRRHARRREGARRRLGICSRRRGSPVRTCVYRNGCVDGMVHLRL